jgi:hypothetical protein
MLHFTRGRRATSKAYEFPDQRGIGSSPPNDAVRLVYRSLHRTDEAGPGYAVLNVGDRSLTNDGR